MEEPPDFHQAYEHLLERLKGSLMPLLYSEEIIGIQPMDGIPPGFCFNFNLVEDAFPEELPIK